MNQIIVLITIMLWNRSNKNKVKSLSKHSCFEALVRPHINYLYNLAYRFSGNQPDAEDLIQDLLLKLFPKYEELVNIENLKSWLSRVLYNLYIDKIRQNDRRPDIANDIDPDAVADDLIQNRASPEAEFSNSQIRKELSRAMHCLNADQKALIVLHDIVEYSLPELATMLDTPVGTLKSRLHRARASLRTILQKNSKIMEPFSEFKRVSK